LKSSSREEKQCIDRLNSALLVDLFKCESY
jgi:hypothetical protein